MKKKRCSKCGEVKPLNEFNKCKKRGFQAYCRPCNSKRLKEYNRTHLKARMVRNAKGRAKKKGVPFNITAEDILIPEVCPVLGVTLEPNHDGTHASNPNSPSLDCIDPKRGYVQGNVWVISVKANRIKNDATPEELMLVATKVYERVYCAQDYVVPNQP